MPQFINSFQSIQLPLHGVRLPKFVLDELDRTNYNIPADATNDEILAILARSGYKQKVDTGVIDNDKKDVYGKRAKYELSVLSRTGFTDYILLVWSVMNYARKNKLAHGIARGSGGGSLINFLIGITDLDPIPHGLFFERFISEYRASKKVIDGVTYLGGCPDIDSDFGQEDREILLRYLYDRYDGHIVKLSTLSTLTTKVLIKDVGKIVGGYDEQTMNMISSLVPVVFGKTHSPQNTYKEVLKFKQFCDENPLVYKIACKLQGLIKTTGSHASAYLVCHDKVEDFIPCQIGTDNEIISSYDMHVAENMAIKLDLLGVNSISLIYNTAKLAGIDLSKIDYNDYDKIYKHLQNLECPFGLFQISGFAAVKGLNKIKPKNFKELCAVLAICRPGALEFVDEFADFTNNGVERATDPLFYDILKDTGQIPLYQEHLMAMFNKIGFSLEDSEKIRRIVGKKKVDEIKEWKSKVYEKAKENGISEETANFVWGVAESSASYSFNLSHSAGYSCLTAMSVLCKFNYPEYFFLEVLRMAQGQSDLTDKIAQIQQELPKFGIQLLAPDIVKSDIDFKLEGRNIRYGISAIKGIASQAIDRLRSFIDREKINKFEVFSAANLSKLNVGIMAALLQSGCLSSCGDDRPKLVLECQVWNVLTDREKVGFLKYGEAYQYDIIEMLRNYTELKDQSGKPLIKDSRIKTIRKKCNGYFDIYHKNRKFPKLAAYFYEKRLLGYSYSYNLREIFKSHSKFISIDEMKMDGIKDSSVYVVAEVVEYKQAKSLKNGTNYIRMIVRDETGETSAMLYGDKARSYFKNGGEDLEEGDIIYLFGRLGDEGTIWVEKMEKQKHTIYIKLGDLKRNESEVTE